MTSTPAQLARRREHAQRTLGGDPWPRAHDDAPEPTDEQALAAYALLDGLGTFTADQFRRMFRAAPPSLRPAIRASAEALIESMELT